ncbi:MAG: hypothetical protein ACFB6R_01700 [Alphaproteobacteria bacterium]
MRVPKLSALFGREKPVERKAIRSPDGLEVGDYVEFGFLPIPDLSNKRFAVAQINHVDYGHGAQRSLVLASGETTVGLSYEAGDQGRALIVTKLLPRPDVEQLFDMDRFATVFDTGLASALPLIGRPEHLDPWLDGSGYEERVDAVPARFRTGTDLQWSTFDFYELEGMSDAGFTLEIEVYDDDTEIYACRALRPDAVEKYWPSGA